MRLAAIIPRWRAEGDWCRSEYGLGPCRIPDTVIDFLQDMGLESVGLARNVFNHTPKRQTVRTIV